MKTIAILMATAKIEKSEEGFSVDTDSLTLETALKHIRALRLETRDAVLRLYLTIDHYQDFKTHFIDQGQNISGNQIEKNLNLAMLDSEIRSCFEPLLSRYGVDPKDVRIISEERARSKMRHQMEKFPRPEDKIGMSGTKQKSCNKKGCAITENPDEDNDEFFNPLTTYRPNCRAVACAVTASAVKNNDELHAFWSGYSPVRGYNEGAYMNTATAASYYYFKHAKPITTYIVMPPITNKGETFSRTYAYQFTDGDSVKPLGLQKI